MVKDFRLSRTDERPIVQIHPCAIGIDHHARISAAMLLHHRPANPLCWPIDREGYIIALREAYEKRFEPLPDMLLPKQ